MALGSIKIDPLWLEYDNHFLYAARCGSLSNPRLTHAFTAPKQAQARRIDSVMLAINPPEFTN